MLKNISNLGKVLTKDEQKHILGGSIIPCNSKRDCYIATGERDWYCSFGYPGQCLPY